MPDQLEKEAIGAVGSYAPCHMSELEAEHIGAVLAGAGLDSGT